MILKLSLQESNSLKGIALILLLIHHLFYIQNGKYDDVYIGNHGIVNTLGILCKVCVALFVFLSGYGLGTTISSYNKFNLRAYYIKRFTKLFLNYWFIWLLFVPIGILSFDRTLECVYGTGIDGIVCGFLDFFGLLNITGKYGYNPTWWFYSCIILLYLIFPLIAYSVSRQRWSIWFFLLISIVIVKIPWVIIQPIRFYLFPFILGILVANKLMFKTLPPPAKNLLNKHIANDLIPRQGSSLLKNVSCLFNGTLGILGIIVMGMLLITSCIIRLSIPYALLWDTCIALLIVLLYKNTQRFVSMRRSLEYLGKHSFNIFLFHTFIYYLYFPFAIYWSRNPIIIFVSLLLSSIVLSVGIERLKLYIGFYQIQSRILNIGKDKIWYKDKNIQNS